MTDFAEYLRQRAKKFRNLCGNYLYYSEFDAALDDEAADEIARLRARIAELEQDEAESKRVIDHDTALLTEYRNEIARLRAALKTAEAECERALREKTWPDCLASVHSAVDSIRAALSPARGDPVPADTGDGK